MFANKGPALFAGKLVLGDLVVSWRDQDRPKVHTTKRAGRERFLDACWRMKSDDDDAACCCCWDEPSTRLWFPTWRDSRKSVSALLLLWSRRHINGCFIY
uniref:(northern house mosquito) hypothetical protein n=1 Tax=Culex pipiens TaxID=7175 RepID=A0A8D8CPC5_CULPI